MWSSTLTEVQQILQCVPSNTATIWSDGGAPLCLSEITHCYIWSFQLLWPCLQQHGTLIYHSAAAQPCWPTRLLPTLYSEALLWHMYFSLTAFCFYIFTYSFLRSTPLNPHFPSSAPLLPLPWVTLSPHVLQHKATAISIICFRASDFQHSHWIRTCQWQFLHTLLYQNRYNQFNAEPHWPIPWKLHQF